jgi:hypothetical protein
MLSVRERNEEAEVHEPASRTDSRMIEITSLKR